jgi:hypothetical protein
VVGILLEPQSHKQEIKLKLLKRVKNDQPTRGGSKFQSVSVLVLTLIDLIHSLS